MQVIFRDCHKELNLSQYLRFSIGVLIPEMQFDGSGSADNFLVKWLQRARGIHVLRGVYSTGLYQASIPLYPPTLLEIICLMRPQLRCVTMCIFAKVF